MVSWDMYFARVQAIELQFRYLISRIPGDAPDGQWLELLRPLLEQPRETEDPLHTSEPWSLDAESALSHSDWTAWHERSLFPTNPPSPPTPKGLIERILQSELVIRVAHFEIFMKDVHRAILRVSPALGLSDKQIHLGRILGDGLQAVIEVEIERAVDTLDRKSVAERAKHLSTTLDLKCFPDGAVETWARLNNLRNTVLHGDPDLHLEEARLRREYPVLLEVPWWAAAISSEKYPGSCEAPRGRAR